MNAKPGVVVTIGSSLQVQGTDEYGAWSGPRVRFIPARRGMQIVSSSTISNAGSSPQGRGACGPQAHAYQKDRLTPAEAGNLSVLVSAVHMMTGASPRGKGAGFQLGRVRFYRGPSPQRRRVGLASRQTHLADRCIPAGRGRGLHADRLASHPWIIPARAGNTCASSATSRKTSAHPCVGRERTRCGFSRPLGWAHPRWRGTPRH